MVNIDNYYKVAREILLDNHFRFGLPSGIDPDLNHMAQLGASVMLTRDKILRGGSFVQSIVNNDLYQAVNRADGTAIKGLKYFLYLREYVHFDSEGNLIK